MVGSLLGARLLVFISPGKLRLVFVIVLLILAIQSAGPSRVGALATYAASLSQRFADAQHALAITTAARDLRSASAAH